MIKNERQYRITKSQAEKFRQALTQIQAIQSDAHTHNKLNKIKEAALKSQLEDLVGQLDEYQSLLSGKRKVIEINSFDDMPRALIQARIAAGLSQKELGERLGIKEQQVQNYEASDYASASLSRIKEVVAALGIHVREEVFLPTANVSSKTLLQRLQSIGLSRGILKDILPVHFYALFESESEGESGSLALRLASIVGRIFNLKPTAIFDTSPLVLNTAALGAARFKAPVNVDERKTVAVSIYAHYLACLALKATDHLKQSFPSLDAQETHDAIVEKYGEITFHSVLHFVWALGIPVLPLQLSGAFHGACLRIAGRNVIVLKQQARFSAKWLNDLIHELCHAGQNPEDKEWAVIEGEDILQSQQESDEEDEARNYAEDVIFNMRADELAKKSVKAANGRLEKLKAIIPQIESAESLPKGTLAYYMAYRLSLQGQNWWGAATNLQDREVDPWALSRDLFLQHANFDCLDETDRSMLLQPLFQQDAAE